MGGAHSCQLNYNFEDSTYSFGPHIIHTAFNQPYPIELNLFFITNIAHYMLFLQWILGLNRVQ